jgi:hypothetical protein
VGYFQKTQSVGRMKTEPKQERKLANNGTTDHVPSLGCLDTDETTHPYLRRVTHSICAKHRLQTATMLVLIFALSLWVRLPMLNKPLCRPREWLSANVLRTLQIWHEIGIAQAHFAPIMSYPGQENKYIDNNASDHSDRWGNYYYTSYPPLAFYVPYVIFEFLHIYPTVLPLQIFNLILHFFSGVFVYLALKVLLECRIEPCVPGIIGFAVYIFSPQTLWLQANVYMSDIFVQVIFTAAIYLVLKWAKHGPSGTRSYFILAALTFCFVYTEWLGLVSAIFLIVFARLNREKDWSNGFQAAVILGATAALALALWQYSSISGFHDFLLSSGHKYLLRSGIGKQPDMNFHPWNLLGWLLLVTYLFLAYAADFLLLLLWVAFKAKGRSLLLPPHMKIALLCSALYPPLLHHLIFFNFTADHEFSTLKEAPIIAIAAGLLAWCLWDIVETTACSAWRMRTLVLLSLAGFFLTAAGEYRVIVGPKDSGYKPIGEYIFKEAHADEIVFVESQDPYKRTDEPFPQMIFYAHRNIARWDERQARELARQNGVSKAVIFILDRAETKVIEQRRVMLPSSL